jgi:hypothetical protein
MPDERDRRARARDDAASKRDIDAAIRDGLSDTDTEPERQARSDARADREDAASDRRDAAADRDAASDARDATRRSGE